MECIELRISKILKVKLSSSKEANKCLPRPVDEESDEDNTNNSHNKTASIVLGSSSRETYSTIRDSFMKEFKVGERKFPSYYNMTKDRPAIETKEIKSDSVSNCIIGNASSIFSIDENETTPTSNIEMLVKDFPYSNYIHTSKTLLSSR